ncbi:MAG: RNA polymerase sigma-70 factor [Cytophagaceae bacterium SCN 52-12]|nr:MAG: RNA polymerase sigma-70 factor [Cytophagaceae bacterium SCN 52-12]
MAEEIPDPGPLIINEESFKALYERYWEKVYAICYTHIRQQEVAQGMVQDIFRSLWERRDSLEINTAPEKYLARAAKFKVFEHIRNVQLRKEHLEKAAAGQPGHTHNTESEIMYNNLRSRVNLLVENLPEKCQRVFRLSREEGFTNKEIANMLSITERAVEYHVARALHALRIRLREYLS